MSDSTPLIMNLGADVAPVNIAGTATGAPQGTDSNGFAGVLGAMMQSAPVKLPEANLTPEQLLANQILMSKLAEGGTELSQDPAQLANMLLPDGKALPEEGGELQWQGMFSHYDSTDPDTPYTLSMEGDNAGYELSELTPEGLFQHSEQFQDVELGPSTSDLRQASALLQERIDQARLQAAVQGQGRSAGSNLPDELMSVGQVGSIAGQQAGSLDPLSLTEMVNSTLADKQGLRPGLINPADFKQTAKADIPTLEDFQAELKGMDPLPKLQTTASNAHQAEMMNMKAEAVQNLSNVDSSTVNKTQNFTNLSNAAASYSALSGVNSTTNVQSSAQIIANMTVPPENPGWGDVVGNRVQWMVNQKIQEAQIRLNPPELGMLEVKVQFGQDQQTNISFSSPHSQVRDALESAIPRLREMFGENGLNLGDVDVSHQSMADQRQAEQGNDGENSDNGSPAAGTLGADDAEHHSPSHTHMTQSDGMLDLYA